MLSNLINPFVTHHQLHYSYRNHKKSETMIAILISEVTNFLVCYSTFAVFTLHFMGKIEKNVMINIVYLNVEIIASGTRFVHNICYFFKFKEIFICCPRYIICNYFSNSQQRAVYSWCREGLPYFYESTKNKKAIRHFHFFMFIDLFWVKTNAYDPFLANLHSNLLQGRWMHR